MFPRGADVELRVLDAGEAHPMWSVTWSGDGRYLATASLDGTARVWHLDLEDLRGLLRAATRVCLDPEYRQDVLGEPPEEARRRWEECERSRGRDMW